MIERARSQIHASGTSRQSRTTPTPQETPSTGLLHSQLPAPGDRSDRRQSSRDGFTPINNATTDQVTGSPMVPRVRPATTPGNTKLPTRIHWNRRQSSKTAATQVQPELRQPRNQLGRGGAASSTIRLTHYQHPRTGKGRNGATRATGFPGEEQRRSGRRAPSSHPRDSLMPSVLGVQKQPRPASCRDPTSRRPCPRPWSAPRPLKAIASP